MRCLDTHATRPELALRAMRVIDLTRRLSGPYCTLLLAAQGADVLKIEPPGGDPMRQRKPLSGSRSIPFAAVNRGKRAAELDLKTEAGRATLLALLAEADVLVENFSPGVMARLGLDRKQLELINPRLIWCSLSAFGQDNPSRADDAAIQALCGLMYATGEPDSPPVRVAPPLSAIANALYGAAAIAAAFHARGQDAGLVHLDVAMLDSLAAVMEYPLMHAALTGKPPPRQAARHPTATPSQTFMAKDGPLIIMAASDAEFIRLASALDRPEWPRDPRFRTNETRTEHRAALQHEIEAALRPNGVSEWFDRLSRQGVACAPVHTVAQALALPAVAARDFVQEYDARHPDEGPIRLTGLPVGPRGAGAPISGSEPVRSREHPRGWLERPAALPARGAAAQAPLAGVKVLDLTRFLAGPYCTMILADLGAGVIKIEPPEGDPTRVFRPRQMLDGGTRSGYFASVNRGKRSLSLNLKQEQDLRILEALIRDADILVENYRPGVMERLGLTPQRLLSLNPDLIHASLSGFGQTGPHATRAAFDMTIQAISGMMSVNGAAGSGPTRAGVSVGDIMTGLYAAVAITAALNKRSAQRIDISMLECQLALLHAHADSVLAGQSPAVKTGAMHGEAVPLGAFRARDGYVHVSAANDRDFQVLCEVLGIPELAAGPEFATAGARSAARDELYTRLGAAFAAGTTADWVKRLQARGLIAAPVRTVAEALESPEFTGRGVMQQSLETRPLTLVASPIRWAGLPPRRPLGPPDLDEARAALSELVSGTDAQIRSRAWRPSQAEPA